MSASKLPNIAGSGAPLKGPVTRREMLERVAAMSATLWAACTSGTIHGHDESSSDALGDGRLAGDMEPADGAPVWQTLPDQIFVVGQPVYLDLSSYCTDPNGDALTFSLDQALPPGLTLNGSIISGTPTALFAPASFVASADDGR